MKNMKKIVALALVMIMTLGLAITASAANTPQNGPFDVTINNATGHQYVIYQIFTADLALDENGEEILSNIKYGADYTPNGKQVGDEAVIPENFDPDDIQPTGNGTNMVTDGDTATATGLTAGYYMIVDVTPNLPEGETLSAVIFQVVGDTDINSKHSKTTIVKKVQDINDTTGEYTVDENDSNWIDSADYDINDVVRYLNRTKKFSVRELLNCFTRYVDQYKTFELSTEEKVELTKKPQEDEIEIEENL